MHATKRDARVYFALALAAVLSINAIFGAGLALVAAAAFLFGCFVVAPAAEVPAAPNRSEEGLPPWQG